MRVEKQTGEVLLFGAGVTACKIPLGENLNQEESIKQKQLYEPNFVIAVRSR